MAATTKQWTLEEVDSLPDDGNRYELVRGELFVTPPPTDPHETIGARLSHLLFAYVEKERLGYVYRPQAVMHFERSEVAPDLMVRQPNPNPDPTWDNAPTPVLVVEIFSPSTRRRDQNQKRSLYMDAGVAAGASAPLTLTVARVRGCGERLTSSRRREETLSDALPSLQPR